LLALFAIVRKKIIEMPKFLKRTNGRNSWDWMNCSIPLIVFDI